MKTAEAEKYQEIGGDLGLVLENMQRLQRDGMSVTVRIPLIPGFNTSPQKTQLICKSLCNAGIKHVDLLPFHRLGSAKYKAMGLAYAYASQEPLTKEELGKIKAIYQTYFSVQTE